MSVAKDVLSAQELAQIQIEVQEARQLRQLQSKRAAAAAKQKKSKEGKAHPHSHRRRRRWDDPFLDSDHARSNFPSFGSDFEDEGEKQDGGPWVGGPTHGPGTTLYDILRVPRTASIEMIKKSYHKLALRYHPGIIYVYIDR